MIPFSFLCHVPRRRSASTQFKYIHNEKYDLTCFMSVPSTRSMTILRRRSMSPCRDIVLSSNIRSPQKNYLPNISHQINWAKKGTSKPNKYQIKVLCHKFKPGEDGSGSCSQACRVMQKRPLNDGFPGKTSTHMCACSQSFISKYASD